MEEKLYKLTASQSLIFFAQTLSIQKQSNTITTSCLIKMDFDEEKLKEAIKCGYRDFECLRIMITRKKFKSYQYLKEDFDVEIPTLDFSDKTKEEETAYIEKNIARLNMTKTNSPLSKTYIMRSQDGYNGVLFCTSHITMDAYAIFAFLKYVIDYYMHLTEGNEAPKKPHPYLPVLQQDLEREASEQKNIDMEYWQKYYIDERPILNDYAGPRSERKIKKKLFTPASDSKHLPLPIEKRIVDKVIDYAKKHSVSPNTIFEAAIAIQCMGINKTNDSSNLVGMARRATLPQKTSGGSRVMSYTIRHICKDEDTFFDFCKEAHTQFFSMMRHTTVSSYDIIRIQQKKYGSADFVTMNFMFQPYVALSPHGEPFKTMWYNSGAAPCNLYGNIMDCDGSGTLYFFYEYRTNYYTVESLEAAHNRFLQILDTALDNPDVTIGELKKIR